MKIKAIEITDIYSRKNEWFYNAPFRELLYYTIGLLDEISRQDDFGAYNITSFDYCKIMDKLDKKFNYNKEV